MEQHGLLQRSHETAIQPCPQPDESCPKQSCIIIIIIIFFFYHLYIGFLNVHSKDS